MPTFAHMVCCQAALSHSLWSVRCRANQQHRAQLQPNATAYALPVDCSAKVHLLNLAHTALSSCLRIESHVTYCTGTGATYGFRFPAKKGYSKIRMPFNAFRPANAGEPLLDSKNLNLTHIAIRFEPDGRYSSTPCGVPPLELS